MMSPHSIGQGGCRWRTACSVLVVLFALSPALESAARAAANPFTGLAGSWSGDGTIKLASGDSERIRCRATYGVSEGGLRLRQDLRCASDSYKFNVESEITYNASAGIVSGTWAETNYSSSGFLTGTLSGGAIKARVRGKTFSAEVDVNTAGNQQMVSIRPQTSEVSEVAVTLRRSG